MPVVKVDRVEARLGGAANVARNVAALRAGVELLSVIGDAVLPSAPFKIASDLNKPSSISWKFKPRLHFGGSLLHEGKGDNAVQPHAVMLQQVNNPLHQDVRLARARRRVHTD